MLLNEVSYELAALLFCVSYALGGLQIFSSNMFLCPFCVATLRHYFILDVKVTE